MESIERLPARTLFIGLVFSCGLCFAVLASAQSPAPVSAPSSTQNAEAPPDDSGGFVFKKEVQEVVLHATVVDQERNLVTNLDRNVFSVFENGVPQPISSFRREDVPVSIGILIDNSGSMRDKREKVNEAVLNLIRVSNPGDQVFVVNFGTDSYLDQDFTSDINLLQQALRNFSTQGSTALYDALVASSVHLERNAQTAKKILLVITDGQDNASELTLQEAERRLQIQDGPIIYAIGLTGDEMRTAGREALQNLAATTGGVAYFPQSLNEVDSITQGVAHDIRSQYTIGYKSTDPSQKDGYRRVQVLAQSVDGRVLSVRTRTGYFAGQELK